MTRCRAIPLVLILAVAGAGLGACEQTEPDASPGEPAAKTPATRTTVVSVPTMHCAGCETTLERELGDVPGVAEVSADYDTFTVRVRHDDSVTPATLIARVTQAGYADSKLAPDEPATRETDAADPEAPAHDHDSDHATH